MSIDAYNKFHRSVKPGASVIVEADLIYVDETLMTKGVKYYRIPAMRKAEALGNRLAANMVMLGVTQVITNAVSVESLEKTITQRFPKFSMLNIKALHWGINLGKKAMEDQ